VDDITTIEYKNHRRLAKKRARAIIYTRGKEKKRLLYKDLVNAVEKTLIYIDDAAVKVDSVPVTDVMALAIWQQQISTLQAIDTTGYSADKAASICR